MSRSALAAATMVLGLALSACTTLEDAPLKARLQRGVDRGYPGMAMVVQGPDRRLRGAATGFADLERHIRMRPDDGFHIGSVTKTFTAVAALRLVDQGRLDLGSTLKDVLGEAAGRIPYADQITISQLLDHASGIYPTNNDLDYLNTVVGPQADPARVWSFEEMIALADKSRQPPTHKPGEGHSYSDTNYILLGMIVEKVTGQPFKEYVRETIFRPLGMGSTYFYSDYLGPDARPPHRHVQGYMLETEAIRRVIAVNPMFKPVPGAHPANGRLLNTTLAAERGDANGGVMSTLPDLMRFADALFRARLLSPGSQAFLMAAADGIMAEDLNRPRTLTLQAVRKPYGVMVYKEGDGPGGSTALMAYLPARDEIYIGFTNRFGGEFDHVDFMMDDVIGPTVTAADARP